MNKVEKDEISQLPDKYHPLTMWSIIGWSLLMNAFFLISFILTWVFAFNRRNINRRSLARYWLLIKLLTLLAIGVAVIMLIVTGQMSEIIEKIKDLIYSLLPN